MSCGWFAALQAAGILSGHIGPKNNSTLNTHTGSPTDFRSKGGCGLPGLPRRSVMEASERCNWFQPRRARQEIELG